MKTLPERDAYLDSACAGDPQLRRAVERLLAADASAGSFFAEGAARCRRSLAEAHFFQQRLEARLGSQGGRKSD